MVVYICGKHSIAEMLKSFCYMKEYPDKLEFRVLPIERKEVCSICKGDANYELLVTYHRLSNWFNVKDLIDLGTRL